MPEKVNRNEVQTLLKNGAQLIEVLGEEEYRWAHLPEAIHIPLWELDRRAVAGLAKHKSIIVYCHDYQ